MAEKELNKIVVLDPCTPGVDELLKKVEAAKQAEVVRLASPEEAIQFVKQYQPCMLVSCTLNNADIPVRVNMLKKLESSIKSGLVKTLFVSKLKNRQLGTLITSMGVTDFIEEPVPARTLQFKANLQLKAVETIRKQQEMKKASQEKIVFKKTEQKQDANSQTTTDFSAKKKPALQLEEDTFLFKSSGVKKVGKKTIVELEGPPPESGDWVQHEDKGDAKTSWRWLPNEKKDVPAAPGKAEGWVHEGEKPTFNEENGKWQFNSEKPDLSYKKGDQKVASKISTDENGDVAVAEDSPKAEENVKKQKDIAVQQRDSQKAKTDSEKKVRADQAKEADQASTLRKINAQKEKNSQEEARKLSAESKGSENSEEIQLKDKSKADNRADERLNRLKEKLNGNQEEEVEEETNLSSTSKEEEAEEKPKSPLDFLKKKREQKEKTKPETITASAKEESDSDNVVSLKKENQAEEKEERILNRVQAEKPEKQKKSATDAAKEALERLKRKVDTASLNKDEEIEEESPTVFGKAEEANPGEAEVLSGGMGTEAESEEDGPRNGLKGQLRNPTKTLKKEVTKPIKPEERKAKKREILAEIQAVLNKPLPEKMSPEEEASLRKELGLLDKKDISPRELAKRAKLNKVKELKEQLENLNNFVEEQIEHKEHDLSKDTIDDAWGQKGSLSEKNSRKLNAYDSETEEEEEAESEKLEKKPKGPKDRATSDRKVEDKYVYLPEADVKPLGGAWENSGEYYVFLAATVRYKGFQKLDDLCPLIFYRGEKIPELLDKTKQWRFVERLPITAERAADIPKDIRDYLFQLKAQVSSESKKQEDIKAKQESFSEEVKDKKERNDIDSHEELQENEKEIRSESQEKSTKIKEMMASLEKEGREKAKESNKEATESPNEEAEEKTSPESNENSAEEISVKKRERNRDVSDLLASLEKESAEQKTTEFSDETVDSLKERGKKGLGNDEDSNLDFDSKKNSDEKSKSEKKKDLADLAKELEAEANEIQKTDGENSSLDSEKEDKKSDAPSSTEENAAKTNRSKESNDLESRLAALKAKMEDPFAEEESTAKASSLTEEAPPIEKVKPAIPVSAEGLDTVKEKLKSESPALEKFLERRKQKKEKEAKSPNPPKAANSDSPGLTSPYLSVYVAVSNAFGSTKDPTRSTQRVLRAIEDAFGNCTAYVFFDKGPVESGTVEISANGTGIGQKIPISSGLACPIQFGVGSEEGSFLGYLFLKPSGTREFFTGAEEETANKVATSLWSVLVSKDKDEAKAA